MNHKIKKIIEGIVPFIIIGVAIALFIGLLLMFFYVAIWGVIIGSVLYLAAMVKHYLSPKAPVQKQQGRIIEHDSKK